MFKNLELKHCNSYLIKQTVLKKKPISCFQGVLELKESHLVDNQTDMAIQYFLDRFYMSRCLLFILNYDLSVGFLYRIFLVRLKSQ